MTLETFFGKKIKFNEIYLLVMLPVFLASVGFYIWFGYSILSYTGESDFIRYSSVLITTMLPITIIAVKALYLKVVGAEEVIFPIFYDNENDKPT